SSSAEQATFSSPVIRSRSIRLLGYTNNSLTPAQRRDALGAICRYAVAGALHVAHETCSLEDIAEAWRRQEAGTAPGRFVLRP
ncbi:MAG: zinc-binding dehydrogenase, partial [Sciscionella sp.]